MAEAMGTTRRNLLGAVAAAALAPAALRAAPPTRPARVGAVLTAFARTAVRAGKAPGASAAAILPGDALATGVAGWADPDRRLPMTPRTRLMSGSTGKTFCAATAMSLVGDGVLDLDRPLAPLFRDEPWYARLPNAKALTMRLLLMHAGGFPQFLDDGDFMRSYVWDAVRGRDTGYSPRKMLSFILDEPPLGPPGRTHHYSDPHYHLAGLAMEKLTGRGYYDLLRERVIAKLGISDILPAVTRRLPGLAAGYARGDIVAAIARRTGKTTDEAGDLRVNPSLEYTGGGLAVTPRALALFLERLATGRIVAPALFEEMVRSSLPVPGAPNTRYGLGLFVTERPELGRYVSHSGYYPGYSSNMGYFLDHGVAVAVQVNTDHGPDIYEALRNAARAVIRA